MSSRREEAREAAASLPSQQPTCAHTCSAGGDWGLWALSPDGSCGRPYSARAARPDCESRGPRWVLTLEGHGRECPNLVGIMEEGALDHGIGTGGEDLEDGGRGELCRGSKGRGFGGGPVASGARLG